MSEKQGYREAMVRLQGRMVESGMDSRRAEQKARETAVKRDRAARDGSDKRKQ